MVHGHTPAFRIHVSFLVLAQSLRSTRWQRNKDSAIGLGKVQLLSLVCHDETREDAGGRAAEVVFVHVSPRQGPPTPKSQEAWCAAASSWAALHLLLAAEETRSGR